MNEEVLQRKRVRNTKVKKSKHYRKFKIIKYVVNGIFILIAAFMCWQGYRIITAQPIKTEQGTIIVDSFDFNLGDTVIITEPKRGDFIGVFQSALFTQNVIVGELIAGPYGKIVETRAPDYRVTHGDLVVNVVLNELPEDIYLNQQYIVRVQARGRVTYDIIVHDKNIRGTVDSSIYSTDAYVSFDDFLGQ